MKLVKRTFLIVNGLLVLFITGVLLFIYVALPRYYISVKTQEAKTTFFQMSQKLDGRSLEEMKQILEENSYSKVNNAVWFSLFSNTSHLVYPPTLLQVDDESSEELQSIIDVSEEAPSTIQTISRALTTSGGERMRLVGEYSFESVSDSVRVLLNLYPSIVFLTLLLGTVSSYLYSKHSSKRVIALSQVTQQMSRLEPDAHCELRGEDEIATLAEDINRLYTRLLATIQSLKRENALVIASEREKAEFLRITSHELKTPIGGVLGMLEGMIYNIGDFSNHSIYLEKCRTILLDLSKILNDLLEVSKMEMGEVASKEFDLQDVLQESLETYKILSEASNHPFRITLSSCLLIGQSDYLIKAIKNLLDNAFRYSAPHGNISLSLNQEMFCLENEVDVALKTEQIEQIFQPFYRPDYGRTREQGGTGLGLFFVKQILENHGYDYSFFMKNERTVCFCIYFNSSSVDKVHAYR